MLSTETFTLNHYSLKGSENISLYKNALKEIGCESAYYCFELLNSAQVENQQLQFFIFKSSDNSAVAVMPYLLRNIILNNVDTGFFDVSSPWGYNGPYFKEGLSAELKIQFWNTVDDWYSENKVVSEFLRFNLFFNFKEYSGESIHTLYNVKGDITDWDLFWSNLKSNTRNQFRKAEKTGLEFKLFYKNITEKQVKDFYQVYIGTMDRRDAIDSFYHPLEYFLDFWKNNEEKCAIGLVYLDGLPISTELFLISEATMYSFLGGTDANHFKLRPNEYLKISAIQWANKEGLNYYMIGGGLSNGKEDNLYLYKKKYFPFDDDIDFYTGRKVVMPTKYLEFLEISGMDNKDALENIKEGFFPRYRAPK
ncbi:Acetyltransferase (GNAT) domain-containing protein [Maribacter orientalis]|uniref:Acetyltransferase (GNAT) domain-containing protein n=1 Tax=Maribacter orientalis TaxID=228957 RepID=A0A1H7SIU4_9FLAO|nr:GNAT family N-acetyltransferase [Maribacter orientalis]SEL71614.1 Acetyltransferase (GNAT) domain-containing protein [Maribacter orientalis]